MPLKDYFGPSFSLPKMPGFLNEDVRVVLTDESRRAFEEGGPKQGYIGIAELPDPSDEDPKLVKLHLIPAFNKNDGRARVNKDGVRFSTRFIESTQSLGTMTGDLHSFAVSALGLGHKGGAHARLMGFGVWKSGIGVRFLDDVPSANARIANEYIVVRNADTKAWEIYFSDQNCDLLQLEPDEGIKECLAKLDEKQLTDLTFEDRQKAEQLLKNKWNFGQNEKEGEIGFAKNRSSSQNAFACEYSEQYKTFFRLAVHERDITRSLNSAHAINLLREIPYRVFEKIINGVTDGLEIAPMTDLRTNSRIPTDWIGPRLHFAWEEYWMNADPSQRVQETALLALVRERVDFLENLLKEVENFDLNEPLSVKEFATKDTPYAEALPLHIAVFLKSSEMVEFLLQHGADVFLVHNNLNSIDIIYKQLEDAPDIISNSNFQQITALLIHRILEENKEGMEYEPLLKLALISKDAKAIQGVCSHMPTDRIIAILNRLNDKERQLIDVDSLSGIISSFSEADKLNMVMKLSNNYGNIEELASLLLPGVNTLANELVNSLDSEQAPSTLDNVQMLEEASQNIFWQLVIEKVVRKPGQFEKLMPYLANDDLRILLLEKAWLHDDSLLKENRSAFYISIQSIGIENRLIKPLQYLIENESLSLTGSFIGLLNESDQEEIYSRILNQYPVYRFEKAFDLINTVPEPMRAAALLPQKNYMHKGEDDKNIRSYILEFFFPHIGSTPGYELEEKYERKLEMMLKFMDLLPEQDRSRVLTTRVGNRLLPFSNPDLFMFLPKVLEKIPEQDRLSVLQNGNVDRTVLHSYISRYVMNALEFTKPAENKPKSKEDDELDFFFNNNELIDDEKEESKKIPEKKAPEKVTSKHLGRRGGARERLKDFVLSSIKSDPHREFENNKARYEKQLKQLMTVIKMLPAKERIHLLMHRDNKGDSHYGRVYYNQGDTLLHPILRAAATDGADLVFPPIKQALDIIALVPEEQRYELLFSTKPPIRMAAGRGHYLELLETCTPQDIINDLTRERKYKGKPTTMLAIFQKTEFKDQAERLLERAKKRLSNTSHVENKHSFFEQQKSPQLEDAKQAASSSTHQSGGPSSQRK